MNLTELFKKTYRNVIYEVDLNKSQITKILFDNMVNLSNVPTTHSIKKARSILFLKDTIRYRKEFFVEKNRVKDKYGLDIGIYEVVIYDGDPEIFKETCKVFIDKSFNNEISEEFFESTSAGTKPPLMDTISTSAGTKPPVMDTEQINGFTVGYSNEKQPKESKMKNVFDKMLETNKNTAVYTAKVQLGKTANKVVLDKIKPQLPMFVKGYADSPIAELVVGNVVAGLLMQFAPNNEKATILANAMIAAGTQVAVESLNIPELVSELLDSVDISGVTEEVKPEV